MEQLFNQAQQHIAQQLPLVLFAYPNQDVIKGYFQRDSVLHSANYSQASFIFCSFDQTQKYAFPKSECNYFEAIIAHQKAVYSTNSTPYNSQDKINFENLVSQAIQTISQDKLEKIVVSRCEHWLQDTLQPLASFKNLLSAYPTAFRYLCYHPTIGMWMGASPELLLKAEQSTITTVALAGTQTVIQNSPWQGKEIHEQAVVTQYITQALQPYSVHVSVSEPQTVTAGNLLHLKTEISADLKPNTSLETIITQLHPTPAVCGLPKTEAYTFIIQTEGYNRKFYTGYLGEIHEESSATLYVNLRCMEWQPNKIIFYTGCGITQQSNPENEFIETHNKSLTLKNILI